MCRFSKLSMLIIGDNISTSAKAWSLKNHLSSQLNPLTEKKKCVAAQKYSQKGLNYNNRCQKQKMTLRVSLFGLFLKKTFNTISKHHIIYQIFINKLILTIHRHFSYSSFILMYLYH